MKRAHRNPIALLSLALLVVLIAVPVVATWHTVWQDHLNRALIAAVKRNDTPGAIALLNAGADARVRNAVVSISFRGALLHLLDQLRGVSIPPATAAGLPLLTLAVANHNVPLATALLDHGAAVDVVDDSNGDDWPDNCSTPLLDAVENQQPDMVQLLLARHANPNARDEM